MGKFVFAIVVALALSGSAEAKRARHPGSGSKLPCSGSDEANRARYPGWCSNGPFGWTYTCRFPKHGLVVIDTRFPDSSITYRGRKYPAVEGSDFYVVTDKPEIQVMFWPDHRRWLWEVGDEARCAGRKNRR